MSWKDLLFDSTPGEPKEESAPPKSKTTSGIAGIPGLGNSTAAPVAAQPTTTITVSADETVSSGIIEKLRAKFSTSPFNSILEQFNTTLESLTEAIPEEGSRFRAALKVLAKSSGLDASKLADAYQSLLSVLDAEAQKFAKMLDQQTATEITQREQQTKSVNDQIEALNVQIQQLMSQRDELGIAIVEQKKKLASLSASFEGAQGRLRAEINDSQTKLKIYLPAASATAATK